MAFVKIKVPRTSQPQDVCGIDWSNPLARGLSLALLPGTGRKNIVDGKFLSGPLTQPEIVGPAGKAIQINQTTVPNEYLLYTVPTGLTSATIFTLTSALGSDSVQPWRTNAAEYDFIPYQSLSNGVYANTFATSRYINGTTFPSTSDVKKYSICATGGSEANSHSLYIDNTLIGSTNSAFSCFSEIEIGRSYFGTSALGAFVYFFWDRVLSQKEIYSLNENPWQIFEPEELTVWIPDVASAPTDNLVPKNIVLSALTSSIPIIGQTHALVQKAVNLSSVSIASVGIGQVHQLVGKDTATGSITISKPALSYVSSIVDLVGNPINLGATTIATTAIGQVHTLAPQAVNLGSLSVSSPTIAQKHALVGSNTALASIVITPVVINQVHVLTANAADIGATTISKPALTAASNVDNLSAKNIAFEAVQLTKPSIEQIHILTGLDVSISELAATKTVIGQIHVLTVQPITLSAASLSKPDLTSLANTDNLSPKDITLAGFTASSPVIGQLHVLVGEPLVTGAVSVVKPVIGQVQSLTPKSVDLGSLSVSNPTLSSGVAIAVYPLPEQVLLGVTYGPTGTEYTGTLVVGTGATVYIQEILSEVVDDQVIVLLQDEVIQSNILSETT